jgi:hypothetical protein
MNRPIVVLMLAALAIAATGTIVHRYWPRRDPPPDKIAVDSPAGHRIARTVSMLVQAAPGELHLLLDAHLDPAARPADRHALVDLVDCLRAASAWSVDSITHQGDATVVVLRVERDDAAAWPSVVFTHTPDGLRLRTVRW